MSARIVRLHITGRVQGVGYRDFVRREADARSVTGWVRNRRDGAVEAVALAPGDMLDDLVAACWRGPPASRVTGIQVAALDPADADLPAAGFAIRPTA